MEEVGGLVMSRSVCRVASPPVEKKVRGVLGPNGGQVVCASLPAARATAASWWAVRILGLQPGSDFSVFVGSLRPLPLPGLYPARLGKVLYNVEPLSRPISARVLAIAVGPLGLARPSFFCLPLDIYYTSAATAGWGQSPCKEGDPPTPPSADHKYQLDRHFFPSLTRPVPSQLSLSVLLCVSRLSLALPAPSSSARCFYRFDWSNPIQKPRFLGLESQPSRLEFSLVRRQAESKVKAAR